MMEVKRQFTGTKWFVEGDIKGCFDNIDHSILVGLLRRRIRDEHFLGLIWKFLKAGYMEGWEYHNTYSGTPQGSIISPILANVYLHELDDFMEAVRGKVQRKGLNAGVPLNTRSMWDISSICAIVSMAKISGRNLRIRRKKRQGWK